jgi:hypothetical protein
MRLLAILRSPDGIEGRDLRDALMSHAKQEMLALWDLYRSGFIREMYSPGGPGAILVLEAESFDDATGRLGELPLIANQIMHLELMEMHPFTALQLLFEAGAGS